MAIVASLEKGIDGTRGAGHDVIFATLALEAFRHRAALRDAELRRRCDERALPVLGSVIG